MCRTAGSACGPTRTSSQGRCLSQLAKLRPPPSPPKQDKWATSAPSPGAQDYTKSIKTTGAPTLLSVASGLRLGFIATPLFTPASDFTLRPAWPTCQEALSPALLSHLSYALPYTLPEDQCPRPALLLVAPGSLSPDAAPSLHSWSKGKGVGTRVGRGFGSNTTGAQDLDAAAVPLLPSDSRF